MLEAIAGVHLTPQQQEILRLLSEGLTTRGIAERLKTTAATVRTQLTRLRKELRRGGTEVPLDSTLAYAEILSKRSKAAGRARARNAEETGSVIRVRIESRPENYGRPSEAEVVRAWRSIERGEEPGDGDAVREARRLMADVRFVRRLEEEGLRGRYGLVLASQGLGTRAERARLLRARAGQLRAMAERRPLLRLAEGSRKLVPDLLARVRQVVSGAWRVTDAELRGLREELGYRESILEAGRALAGGEEAEGGVALAVRPRWGGQAPDVGLAMKMNPRGRKARAAGKWAVVLPGGRLWTEDGREESCEGSRVVRGGWMLPLGMIRPGDLVRVFEGERGRLCELVNDAAERVGEAVVRMLDAVRSGLGWSRFDRPPAASVVGA